MGEARYTAGQVAKRTGVSVRALHHYESMGLLRPQRRANGYREYGSADLERLQHILLYRSCGMELADIRSLLDAPGFDALAALRQHLAALQIRREALDQLIRTVQTTIDSKEREIPMNDQARFESIKQAAVAANERGFGREARERHGDAAIDAANERLLGMSESEWNDMNVLETRIIDQLRAAMETGDAESDEAKELAAMHARWIALHWGEGSYTVESHLGLAQGYLADERFRDYYDSRAGTGATEFLVRALEAALC